MRKLLLLFPLLFVAPLMMGQASCTTAICNAASASPTDVLAALPSSSNANTAVVVNIPTSTATWSTTFSYTVPAAVHSLTIQGATVVTCTGTAGTVGYSCSSTDRSVLNDNVTNPSTPLMVIDTTNATDLFRITGITLQPLNGTITAKSQGMVQFTGNTKNFRWDNSHIVVSTNDNAGPEFDGQIEGVIDHNKLDLGAITDFTNGFRIYNDLLDSVGRGDGGWMAATQFGSQHAIFLESNYVTGGYTTDCGQAGREVLRYNTFVNSQDASGAVHSTKDPEGDHRGCRSIEFYKNYMSSTGGGVSSSNTGGESGSLLNWGNTVGNLSGNRYWSGGAWRNQPGQVGNMGTNQCPPNGWGMTGTSSGYPNGTHTCSGSSTAAVSAWDGNSVSTTGYPGLDAVGRGQQQDAMNGAAFPSRINTASGIVSWPHQYLEPIYFWGNTLPGGMAGFININDISSAADRDYFMDCGSYNSACSGGFTGAKGTGHGPFSSRPGTCASGPGGSFGASPGGGSWGTVYFADDTQSAYVCDGLSANHWTLFYQPYVFPHPLVSGACALSFSPAAGTYVGTQTVTISKSSCPAGTSVFYRTDGFPATAIDTLYSAPISVSSSQTLTAIAVLNPTIRDQPQTISGQKKCNAIGSPITFPSGYSCNNGSGGVAGTASDFNFTAGSSNQWFVSTTDAVAFDTSVLHIDTPTTTPDTAIVAMSYRTAFQDSSNCGQSAGNLYKCIDVSEFDAESAKDPTTNALWQMSSRCSTNASGSSGNNGFIEGTASAGNEKWDIPCVIGAPTDITVNVHWTLGDTGCGGSGCMVLDSIYLKTGAGALTAYNFPASCDVSNTHCPNYPMTPQPSYSNFTAGSQQQLYARNVGVAGTSPLTTTRSTSFLRVGVHEGTQTTGSAAYVISAGGGSKPRSLSVIMLSQATQSTRTEKGER